MSTNIFAAPAAVLFLIVSIAGATSSTPPTPVRVAFAAGAAAVITAWLLARAIGDAAHEHAAALVAVAKAQRPAPGAPPSPDELVAAVEAVAAQPNGAHTPSSVPWGSRPL